MDLILTRHTFTPYSTIGDLTLGGVHVCHVLEDCDRGLDWTMPSADIESLKVFGRTAIPAGSYVVRVTWSPRFRQMMPILVGVPGYEGVRIHPGNTDADTEGCLLPGVVAGADRVERSRDAYQHVLGLLLGAAAKGDVVTLTINRNGAPATGGGKAGG